MEQAGGEYDPERLTWAGLLSQWMSFAKTAAALPTEGEAGLVRKSTTDLITLQAVCFALQHLDELDANQRALGLDRAAVLIERHSEALRERFEQGTMPQTIREMIDEAYAQLPSE